MGVWKVLDQMIDEYVGMEPTYYEDCNGNSVEVMECVDLELAKCLKEEITRHIRHQAPLEGSALAVWNEWTERMQTSDVNHQL